MKIYFCQLIGHFPSIERTICLIHLTTHKEVLAAFSKWLYILMYFSFYSPLESSPIQPMETVCIS